LLGEIKNSIRKEILAQSAITGRSLADDEDLFSSGFLDSMSFMMLLVFIQKELGVSFPRTELRFENFRTINVISERVEKARK
jgi:methoxymalonate biosynthesis acyl carrier protein